MGKQTGAVMRKELAGYFGSPLALIFLATFVGVTLFIFFWVETFFARGIADVRPLFTLQDTGLLAREFVLARWTEGDMKKGIFEFQIDGLTNSVRYENCIIQELREAGGAVTKVNQRPQVEYRILEKTVLGLPIQLAPAVAMDPESDPLQFKLLLAPSSAEIDPASGRLSWTPQTNQAGNHVLVISATDLGNPPLETVAVFELSTLRPPLVKLAPSYLITETHSLTLSNFFDAPDVPRDDVVISLSGEANQIGMTFNPANGTLHLQPSESAGPRHLSIDITVASRTDPRLTATSTFLLDVQEENSGPQILPLSDQKLALGDTLVLTAKVSDPDIPVNRHTFRLEGDSHGASVDPVTGIFLWVPHNTLNPGSYQFLISTVDDGQPPLSQTVVLSVELREPPAVLLTRIDRDSLKVVVARGVGRAYRLETSSDLRDWTPVASGLISTDQFEIEQPIVVQPLPGFFRVFTTPQTDLIQLPNP